MKNKVKIAVHPESKEIITVNANKPEFGTIRLDQQVTLFENGFLNKSKRSAFITGKIEDLKSMNFNKKEVFPGNIVRKESRKPFFEGQSAKINPTTKKEVLVDGEKVYFQDKYTEDPKAFDELIKAGEVNTTANNLVAELVD